MKILKAGLDLDRFFQRLVRSDLGALLLDYDGTLAPFRVDREEARPYPGIRRVLREILAEGRSRLVITSGRKISSLLPLLDLDPPPEIWGSHGWERRLPDGTVETAPMDAASLQALESLRIRMEQEGFGNRIEEKPGCLALHWRGLDAETTDSLQERYTPAWADLSQRFSLSLIEFDGGIELRIRGRDKGSVIRHLRAQMGQKAVLAFLGDDATDEEAFAALDEEDLGVLVRPEYRPTGADLWLSPPGELIAFLRSWREATSRNPEETGSILLDETPKAKGGQP